MRISIENRRFFPKRDQFGLKFPINHSSHWKTRMIVLSYDVKI